MSFEVLTTDAQPELAERLMRALPDWFGIEESIVEYVEDARRLPTTIARDAAGTGIGILLLKQHFPESSEIQLMAVDPAWHRRGVGRALVQHAESKLRDEGATTMSVKTLGPSHPDAGYALTRQFYRACGFAPVEEFADLWPGNPCLLMVKAIGV